MIVENMHECFLVAHSFDVGYDFPYASVSVWKAHDVIAYEMWKKHPTSKPFLSGDIVLFDPSIDNVSIEVIEDYDSEWLIDYVSKRAGANALLDMLLVEIYKQMGLETKE